MTHPDSACIRAVCVPMMSPGGILRRHHTSRPRPMQGAPANQSAATVQRQRRCRPSPRLSHARTSRTEWHDAQTSRKTSVSCRKSRASHLSDLGLGARWRPVRGMISGRNLVRQRAATSHSRQSNGLPIAPRSLDVVLTPAGRRQAPLSAVTVADPCLRAARREGRNRRNRCRILGTRLSTAPNHSSALTPTHTDGVDPLGPLREHTMESSELFLYKTTKRAQCDKKSVPRLTSEIRGSPPRARRGAEGL